MSNINAKAIADKIKKKDEKGPVSLYLSKELYAYFQHICSGLDVPASQVVEELMNEFIVSAERDKGWMTPERAVKASKSKKGRKGSK